MKKFMHLALVAVMTLAMGASFTSCGGDDNNVIIIPKTNDQVIKMMVGTWNISEGYVENDNTAYDEVTSTMKITVATQLINNTTKASYTMEIKIDTETRQPGAYDPSTGTYLTETNNLSYQKSNTIIMEKDAVCSTIVGSFDSFIYYQSVTDDSFKFSFNGLKWYTATRKN